MLRWFWLVSVGYEKEMIAINEIIVLVECHIVLLY